MAVSFEEFKKIDLRTAKILDAVEIDGADRIWKLLIEVGSEKKQIVAGIKKFYTKEALVGRTIIVVHNLAPSVIRGVESQGMLLAAKDGDRLSLLTVDTESASGSPVG